MQSEEQRKEINNLETQLKIAQLKADYRETQVRLLKASVEEREIRAVLQKIKATESASS